MVHMHQLHAPGVTHINHNYDFGHGKKEKQDHQKLATLIRWRQYQTDHFHPYHGPFTDHPEKRF